MRELLARGLDETSADRVVKRFALQARRLNLDLKQRREEEVLALKHTLENVFLEIEGFEGTEIDSILDQFLPMAVAASPARVAPLSVSPEPPTR